MPKAAPESIRWRVARESSAAKVRRPTWSETTDGETPLAARVAIVRTKFLPSPITHEVRTR